MESDADRIDAREQSLELIRRLWNEYRAAPYPERLLGVAVEDIDLVMLDNGIAGCIETFLARGNLDVWRTAILGRSYQQASRVVPLLYKEGARYFWRLQRLADLVLRELLTVNQHLR